MQLTRFSDYTLRTLLYLGAHPGEVVPTNIISDVYGISLEHTIKAAKRLSQLGYVRTQRGKNGGLTIACAPESIGLGKLIRETEGQLDLLECFDPETDTCPLSPACRLKHVLHRARDAFLAVLDEYTLADLLANAPELMQLLPRVPRPRG